MNENTLELHKKRAELQDRIYELVSKFTEETGFHVQSIDVPLEETTRFGDRYTSYRYGAPRVEITLGHEVV